jgi:hypothetical protein
LYSGIHMRRTRRRSSGFGTSVGQAPGMRHALVESGQL